MITRKRNHQARGNTATWTLLALVSLLGACGGGGGDRDTRVEPAPPAVAQGLLVSAGSEGNFVATVKAAFTQAVVSANQQAGGDLLAGAIPFDTVGPLPVGAPLAAASGNVAASSFSTTYSQEAEVAEYDAVKYDGERLFIAPRVVCCYVSEPTLFDANTDVQPASKIDAIRVLTSNPEAATVSETARIELPEDTGVQGMYLTGDTLVTLTSEDFFGRWGAGWLSAVPWFGVQHGLQLYDVSDSSAPVLTFDASFDGSFIESRRVGDTVYLVSRYTPVIDDLVYAPATDEARARNSELLEAVQLQDLMPHVRINGQTRDLINPASCLVSNNSADALGRLNTIVGDSQEQPLSPVLTIITAVDLNNPDQLRSLCYNEQAYGLYASTQAVYLTQLLVDSGANSERTRIHKFDLASLSYRGSAEVEGLLWSGGQLDFRASEHEGVLRLITSRSTNDAADSIDHQLYVLEEAEDQPKLSVLATLPNESSPAEIGKPNEALYGVRFFGDRAYAVTFEQIDPLYVLDLSDPSAPRLAGELEVPGFSDFLHPVNEDLLLGFGRAENQALKLELFDVSDITAPRSLAIETLGGAWSHSEALYNRQAFTYLSNVTRGSVTVDRFAIPADLYDSVPGFNWVESGLYLYEIGNRTDPTAATLNTVGAVVFDQPSADRWWPVGGRYRSILDGDSVYAIRNEEVFGALWTDPTQVIGPQ